MTLPGAHGGTGKSLIALMLAVSTALGLPLFGVPTTAAPVVFFSAEDGADTVRRRLQAVVRALGVNAADLVGRLTILDATQGIPELAAPQWATETAGGRQQFAVTLLGQELRSHLAELVAPLVIVDNASDMMGGNENARTEVRAFLRLLAGMVRGSGGAVLLLAHVDKGTSRGDRGGSEGYSGSTAWHNSARSRLYLTRDRDGAGLVLEHQKCNLGPMREPLRLVWSADHLPVLSEPQSPAVEADQSDSKAFALLRLIDEFNSRGEFVTTAVNGRPHAGKLLRTSRGFPPGTTDPQVFELLRAAERRCWLERAEYRGADRKPRERWSVTAMGMAAAGIRAPAASAASAASAMDAAVYASGQVILNRCEAAARIVST